MILGIRTSLFLLVFTILTAFSSAAVEKFSFAAFGDNRDGRATYKLLLDKVSKDKTIAFGINTGDFVSRGRESEYIEYKNLVSQYPALKIYHVMGNHDGVFGGWRLFLKYFGPYYYSFDYKNAHFVILNNAFRESFSDDQINWLIRDLAATDKTHKIVSFHKPAFDASGFYDGHIMDSRRMAERMIGIFKRYKVDYVICGHIHGYAHAERDGVNYIVTAGAGALLHLPPEFGGYYHYVRFDIDGKRIKSSVLRVFE